MRTTILKRELSGIPTSNGSHGFPVGRRMGYPTHTYPNCLLYILGGVQPLSPQQEEWERHCILWPVSFAAGKKRRERFLKGYQDSPLFPICVRFRKKKKKCSIEGRHPSLSGWTPAVNNAWQVDKTASLSFSSLSFSLEWQVMESCCASSVNLYDFFLMFSTCDQVWPGTQSCKNHCILAFFC